MRALVLGSTGCIGNNIVRACLDSGWSVRAFHRPQSRTWMLDGLDVECVAGSFEEPGSLLAAMRGCDLVFHAAAHYPLHSLDLARSVRVATREIRAVLQSVAQSRPARLIYTSSLSTVGAPTRTPDVADERDHYLPGSTGSAYFEAKWAMEQEAWRACAEGVPVTIVNPAATFGPWDTKPATGQILLALARGRFPFWLDLVANVVDARDVARGQILAAEAGQVGQRYILGGQNLALREALSIAAREAGVPPPRFRLPLRALRAAVRLGEVAGRLHVLRPLPLEHLKTIQEWRALSIHKAQSELGYVPRPYVETIRDTLAWFRAHRYL